MKQTIKVTSTIRKIKNYGQEFFIQGERRAIGVNMEQIECLKKIPMGQQVEFELEYHNKGLSSCCIYLISFKIVEP